MTIGCHTYLSSHMMGVSHVAHANTKVSLASLAYTDMASKHKLTERLNMSHMDDVINIVLFTFVIYGVTRDDRSRHK